MSTERQLAPDTSWQPAILVVDDNEIICGLVRIFLQSEGYPVLSAADGRSALEFSRTYPGTIDLVITDVEMPWLRGTELVPYLLKERPGIKVIVMTGRQRTDIAFPLLPKPFDGKMLMTKVYEVLTSSGQSKAAS